MENTTLITLLTKFLERELYPFGGQERPLTVGDFRLSIRNLRLTEMIDWSNHNLDLLEAHASRFEYHAPLESLTAVPAEDDLAIDATAPSAICAPSPFAWM